MSLSVHEKTFKGIQIVQLYNKNVLVHQVLRPNILSVFVCSTINYDNFFCICVSHGFQTCNFQVREL